MTSTHRLLALAAAAALALTIAGCSATPGAPIDAPATDDMAAVAAQYACEGDEGVTVTVDASALGEPVETWCVFGDDEIGADDALTAAGGITTEGTDQYADQVVCRVDGIPAADTVLTAADGTQYQESCETMPAAFAYWSIWVKPAGGEWGYAEEGLPTLRLQPGESLALLFTLNGEPATP